MRVQGNISPVTHIEPYLNTGLYELRVYENIKKIDENLFEYDEYVFHIPYTSTEEVDAKHDDWVMTGRSLEQDTQSTPYVEKVEEVQKAVEDKERAETEKIAFEEQGTSLLTQSVASGVKPSAKAAVFAKGYDEWEPNQNYKGKTLLQYKGDLVYVVSDILSLANYPPFSTGTEANYNARPYPLDYSANLYPYVRTMEAEVGMRVQYGEDVYVCKEYLNMVLYSPDQLPRYFDKEV